MARRRNVLHAGAYRSVMCKHSCRHRPNLCLTLFADLLVGLRGAGHRALPLSTEHLINLRSSSSQVGIENDRLLANTVITGVSSPTR